MHHSQPESRDSNQYSLIDHSSNFSDEVELLRDQADLIVPTMDNGEIGMVFDSERTAEIAKQQASLIEQGYLTCEEQPTRFEYIMGKIKENPSGGVYPLDNYGDTSNIPLPFFPTFPDQEFVSANSESVLILGGDNAIKQLHTNTRFGNLIIDESRNTSMSLENPNIEGVAKEAFINLAEHLVSNQTNY